MIRVSVKEPTSPEWPTHNPYLVALDAWKEACEQLGLVYVPNGSNVAELQPGQWCIKSYDPVNRKWNGGRHVCFHDSNARQAILFKLQWG